MQIPAAINNLATFLVPAATQEQVAGISGVMKLFLRWENYSVPAREAALVLTRAEEAVLLRGARRLLVKLGARIFLVAAVLDFARGIIAPNEEKKTVATRLEIIQAHLLKGGPLWTTAAGVAEQVLFLLTDNLGDVMFDAAAAVISDIAGANIAPVPGSSIWDSQAYRELAPPVEDVRQVDSIFQVSPAILLQPALMPFATSDQTFPAGPRPSFGRRS